MPQFIVTSPEGKQYKVNAPEGATQEDAIAYVQTNVLPKSAQMPTWERLAEAGGRAIQKRGVGIIQAGMEAFGETDNPIYEASQRAVADINKVSEADTSISSAVVGALADPVNLAYGALPFGGLLKTAAVGGTGGAIEGLTRGTEEGESRILNTLASGATGAVVAPALQVAGGVIGKVANPLARKVAEGYQTVKGMVSGADDIALMISQAGGQGFSNKQVMDAVKSLGDDAVKTMKQGVKSGLSPRVAALNAIAEGQGVKLSRGQLTQEPALQRLEDLAQQGVLGERAREVAAASESANKAALSDWANRMRSTVSGDLPLDATTVGATIGAELRGAERAAKKVAGEAFSAGVKTEARIPSDTFKGFTQGVRKTLVDDGFDIGAMPLLDRTFQQLGKAEKIMSKVTATQNNAKNMGIAYKPLEVYRKRIFQATQNAATPSEKAALQRVYGQYVNKLDDVIENGLINGGDEAAKQLRQAPALWRDYKQSFYGQKGEKVIGKIVEKGYNDKKIADLLGSSAWGNSEALNMVRQLKQVLPENSEAIAQTRGLYLDRIMDGAFTKPNTVIGKDLGLKLKTNWDKALSNNKQLIDELYTPDMQQVITDYVDTVFLNTVKNRSKVNPSGSGVVMADLAFRMFDKLGSGGGTIATILGEVGKQATKGGEAAKAIQAISKPLLNAGQMSIISDTIKAAAPMAAGIVGRNMDVRPAQPVTINPAAQGTQGAPDATLPATIPDTSFTQQNEGVRLSTYTDTQGNPTVGYGFNFNSGIAPKVWKMAGISKRYNAVKAGRETITPQEAQALYQTSQAIAMKDAKSYFPDFDKLNQGQQIALMDMSYQFGLPKLKEMKSLRSALQRGDKNAIVNAIRNSEYGRKYETRAQKVAQLLIGETQMTSPSDVKTASINAHKTRHILQSAATSTVAGGEADIAFDGLYIFSVSGTLNTAQPTLYVKRSGEPSFAAITSNTGNNTILDAAGEECTVYLSRGDKVYSQTTVVGGSTNYTTVLNLTTA